MAAPDPESVAIFAQVMVAGAAIGGPIWIAFNWFESKLAKKMDNTDFADFCRRFDQHCRDDRETQAKLFDKVDEVKTLLIERMK